MIILLLMSSSPSSASAVADRLADAVGWPILDGRLPDAADPGRSSGWADLREQLRAPRGNLIVSTPMLSDAELKTLDARTVELVWLKQPSEVDRVPVPGALVIDGSMPAQSIAWTICAVLQIAAASS